MKRETRMKAKAKAAAKPKAGAAAKPKAAGKFIYPCACRLLENIDRAGFDRLCECMKARELHLRPKETFIREKDPCLWVGVVVTGAVRLTRTRIDGGVSVLETVGANDVFGSTYVFRGAPTMGLNMSAVGETVVLLFSVESITHPCHKVCGAHVQYLRNLLTVMSQKTFQIKQKLRILSQHTIRGRLMLFLNIRAKRAKSSEFEIPFDRQALADFLCVDRSALSAEISKLRKEGKLDAEKNRFRLLG